MKYLRMLFKIIKVFFRHKSYDFKKAEEASKDLRNATDRFKAKHFENLAIKYEEKAWFYKELFEVQKAENKLLKKQLDE